MTDDEIFSFALGALAESWATQSIPARLGAPGYDAAIGKAICRLMFEKCERSPEAFRAAVGDFMLLSEEFVRLQFDLDRTGHYTYSSFDEVRAIVYDNPEMMDRRYLNGLFLSGAFWTNHTAIFRYFIDRFCAVEAPPGTILEVPVGTGIFISEFARRNPGWTALGIDISESSVRFSRAMAQLNGGRDVRIAKQDVFDLPAGQTYGRIICGELLEHLENPEQLLDKLAALLSSGGTLFLTTAVWAASLDHIYLFRTAQEVRDMLERYFTIASELVLNVRDGKGPGDAKTPINYACILSAKP